MKIKKHIRHLDDQAVVFSLSRNMKDTSIFRLSVVLKEKVEPSLLKRAVNEALEKYKVYKVKMKAGIFGYYLEENSKLPIIVKEKKKLFKRLNTPENNDYLFQVSYETKKINIEIFHPLTDGNGGTEFFKEIISRYLELRHPKIFIRNQEAIPEAIVTSENAYKKHYPKRTKPAYNPPRGYRIKGKKLTNDTIGINHFSIKLSELKVLSKENNCSISELLVSMLIYSIYHGNYKKSKTKRPINVCLPVDLRKYYETKTISNFISYFVVSLKLKGNNHYSFEEILDKVIKEFKNKLQKERITETMNSNGKIINNPFIKSVPLLIKRACVVLGTIGFKTKFSTIVSNLGEFKIGEKYKKYIEDYHFTLSPDWAEKVRCGVVSYNKNLIMTFSTNILESNIEKEFKALLDSFKLKYTIKNNGVNKIA